MSPYNGFTPEQRNRAQAWLNKQWKDGALHKPARCCACGQDQGVIDAHAEDYSMPFEAGKTDEYHLCFTCHMMVHCRHRNRNAWQQYKDVVADGGRYPPFMTRNWPAFMQEFLEGRHTRQPIYYEPPTRLALEDIERHMSKEAHHGSQLEINQEGLRSR